MAISIDWNSLVISVPQADLTPVSGTLYDMDTDWFRLQVLDLLDDEAGIPFPDAFVHNTEVTVAGTTFARTIEVVNGYSVEFTPDSQWSVRLVGSNNNIFDVENGILVQNQVQVIPTNSAGLISSSTVSGLTAAESQALLDIDANVDTNTTSLTAIEASIVSIEGDIATIETDVGLIQVDQAFATKVVRNKKITNETTGILTVYEDNGTDVFMECAIYKSLDTSTPYDGTGIQRQERLETP